MNIRDLDFFIKVYECRSISIASEKLFISAQGLSNAISRLEKELGCTFAKYMSPELEQKYERNFEEKEMEITRRMGMMAMMETRMKKTPQKNWYRFSEALYTPLPDVFSFCGPCMDLAVVVIR